MNRSGNILDQYGREARLPSPRRPAQDEPTIAPYIDSVPSPPPEPAPVSGWRRAFQVADAMLGVIFAVAVIALVAFGCVWLLGLLFGRRGDR